MRYKKFLKQLQKKDGVVFFDEPLSKHCSFRIGGKAKFFVVVSNTKTLIEIFKRARKIFVLGAGTNTVFANKKFNGTFLKLGGNFLKIKVKDRKVVCGGGVNLWQLAKVLRENNLAGLEFAFGIPGTVGAATAINAGAFGGEIGNFIKKVKVFDGKRVFWTKKFNFSYRNSSFKEKNQIVLAVQFEFVEGSYDEIFKLQNEYFEKRKNSQPYSVPSAGSVFKRIIKSNEILYPAKMIDKLGLKGVKIGDAKISEKHAGFIVNTGNATFNDVSKLVRKIKRKVKRKFGESLQEEIIFFRGKRNDYFWRLSHPHHKFKRKT